MPEDKSFIYKTEAKHKTYHEHPIFQQKKNIVKTYEIVTL